MGRCVSSMHDREPDNSQAVGMVGLVQQVGEKMEASAKGDYIKAKRERLSKS